MNSLCQAKCFLHAGGSNLLIHVPIPRSFLVAWLALFTAWNAHAAQIKIYINTDLEGASGVYKFAQTREVDTPAQPASQRILHG